MGHRLLFLITDWPASMTQFCHNIYSVAIASAAGIFGGLGGLVSR